MDELLKPPARDLWSALQQLTQARISLGRSGDAVPTRAVLAFEVAQAQARDAVHAVLDVAALQKTLAEFGLLSQAVQSQAPDRATYLRRPDLGRRLSDASRTAIAANEKSLTIVIADGLSAAAAAQHAVPLLAQLQPYRVLSHTAVYIASQARVALGDEIGERSGAEAVLVLIGERPGLTTPASLGAYLTWHPRAGRTDAERNCVSNIHPHGLRYDKAAAKLHALLQGARRLGATGVALHDETATPARQLI